MSDVPYSTPTTNNEGAGIDFVPTRGSGCIVLKKSSNYASDTDRTPFIIAFKPPSLNVESTSWQGGRLNLAEGDVIISSPELNRVEVLSNGVTKVMSSDVCSIELYPDTQKIETVCNQYSLITAGGSVEWSSDDTEDVGSAHLRVAVKSTSTTEVGASELFIFEAGDAGTPKVIMRVLDPDTSSDTGKLLWSCDAEGEMILDVKKTISVTTGESASITAKGGLYFESPTIDATIGTASLSVTSSDLILDVPNITIKTDRLTIQSRSQEQVFFDTGTEDIEDTLNKQLVTEDILSWLFNHVHLGNGVPALGRPIDTTEISTEDIDAEQLAEALTEMQSSIPTSTLQDNINLVLPGANAPSGVNTLSALYPFLAVPPTPENISVAVQSIIGQVIATSQILHERLQLEQDELSKAVGTGWSSGDPPLAGALVSYSQVLTQATKVR